MNGTGAQCGVNINTDPYLTALTGWYHSINKVQVSNRIHHEGHAFHCARIVDQAVQPLAVGGGVGDEDVIADLLLAQPQGFIEVIGQNAAIAGEGEDLRDQRTDAERFTGHPNRGTAGTVRHVQGVGSGGIQIQHREGCVQVRHCEANIFFHEK